MGKTNSITNEQLQLTVIKEDGNIEVLNSFDLTNLQLKQKDKLKLKVLKKSLKDINNEDLIVVKNGDNLEIYYGDGTSLTLEGFYTFEDISLELPTGEFETHLLSSIVEDSSNNISVVYAQGNMSNFKSLIEGNEALSNAMSNYNHSLTGLNAGDEVVEMGAIESATGLTQTAQLVLGGLLVSGGVVAIASSGGSSGGSSSSSDTTQIGQLVDSAVSGVAYYINGSANPAGYTDANGYFTYKAGDIVTFQVGNVILKANYDTKTIPSDKKVTLQDLLGVDRNKTGDAQVVKLAQFLQTLDADGNADNGIQIVTNKDGKAIKTNADDINSTTDLDTNNDGVIDEAELKAAREAYKDSSDTLLDDATTSNDTDITKDTNINTLFKNTVTVKTEDQVKEHLDKQLEIINDANKAKKISTLEAFTKAIEDGFTNIIIDKDLDLTEVDLSKFNGIITVNNYKSDTSIGIKVTFEQFETLKIKNSSDDTINVVIKKDTDISQKDLSELESITVIGANVKLNLEQLSKVEFESTNSKDATYEIIDQLDDILEADEVLVQGASKITAKLPENGSLNDLSSKNLESIDIIDLNGQNNITVSVAQIDISFINGQNMTLSIKDSFASLNTLSNKTENFILKDATSIENLKTLESKTTGSVSFGSIIDSYTNLTDLNNENYFTQNPKIELTEEVSVANLSNIDNLTTGKITATISDKDITTLLTLPNSNHALTLTVSDTTATASDLLAISGKTSKAIDASAVRSFEGTVKELVEYLATGGTLADDVNITLLGDKAATQEELKTINEATTGTITLNEATKNSDFSGTIEEILEILDGTSGYAGDVTLTGETAATLSELKTLNNLSTGAITLNDATKATTLEGTKEDIIAALDGITLFTGNIKITENLSIQEFNTIDDLTTGSLNYKLVDSTENLFNETNATIVANSTAITLTDDIKELGALTLDKIKIIDKATNKAEYTYTASISIEDLLSLDTLPTTYTLSDETTVHTDINIKTAIILSGATNSDNYTYTIKDTALNILTQISQGTAKPSLTKASTITLTDTSISATNLKTIASKVKVTLEEISITGELAAINSLYTTPVALENITGLADADIIVSAGDDKKITSTEITTLLGLSTTTQNIIIDSSNSPSINIVFGLTKGSTTIDGTTYTTYTNASNKSFMIKSTSENVIVEGTLAQFKTLDTLPEKYILTNPKKTTFESIDVKTANIILGDQNKNSNQYKYSLSDFESELIAELDANSDVVTKATSIYLKLSATKDFTDTTLDVRIDGLDLNGFDATLSVAQAQLKVIDSTNSATSSATVELDSANHNLFGLTLGKKVGIVDFNGQTDIILSLDAALLTLVDSQGTPDKATVKLDGESVLSGRLNLDFIDTFDLYDDEDAYISLDHYARYKDNTLTITDSYPNRDWSKDPIEENLNILDTLTNFTNNTQDLSAIVEERSDVIAIVDKANFNLSNITLNSHITKLYLNGHEVSINATDYYTKYDSSIYYSSIIDGGAEAYDFEAEGNYEDGLLNIHLTENLVFTGGENSYGENYEKKIFLNGHSATIDIESASLLDESNFKVSNNTYSLNGSSELTIMDTVSNLYESKIVDVDSILKDIIQKTILLTNNYNDGEVTTKSGSYYELNSIFNVVDGYDYNLYEDFTFKVQTKEEALYFEDLIENFDKLEGVINQAIADGKLDLNNNKIGFSTYDDTTVADIVDFEAILATKQNYILYKIVTLEDTAAHLVAKLDYVAKVSYELIITELDTLAQLNTIKSSYTGNKKITFSDAANTTTFTDTYANLFAAFDKTNDYEGSLIVSDSITAEQLYDLYWKVEGSITANFSVDAIDTLIKDEENDTDELDSGQIIFKITDTNLTITEINTLDTTLESATILISSATTISGTANEITSFLTNKGADVITSDAKFSVEGTISVEDLNTIIESTNSTVTYTIITDTAENILAQIASDTTNSTTMISGASSIIVTNETAVDFTVEEVTTLNTVNTNITLSNGYNLVDTVAHLQAADNMYTQYAKAIKIKDTAENILAQISSDTTNSTTIISSATTINTNDATAVDLSVEQLNILTQAGVTITNGYNIVDTMEHITVNITDGVANNLLLDSNSISIEDSEIVNVGDINTLIATLSEATISITYTGVKVKGNKDQYDLLLGNIYEGKITVSALDPANNMSLELTLEPHLENDAKVDFVLADTINILSAYGKVILDSTSVTIEGNISQFDDLAVLDNSKLSIEGEKTLELYQTSDENDTEFLSQVIFETLTQKMNESSTQAFTKIDLADIDGISLKGGSLDLSSFGELSNLDGKTISLTNGSEDILSLTADDLFATSDNYGDLAFTITGETGDILNLSEGWTQVESTNVYKATGNFNGIEGNETYTITVTDIIVNIA